MKIALIRIKQDQSEIVSWQDAGCYYTTFKLYQVKPIEHE